MKFKLSELLLNIGICKGLGFRTSIQGFYCCSEQFEYWEQRLDERPLLAVQEEKIC